MMLNVNQVGEQLGISPSLVRREIEEGRLAHHVFGKGAIRVSEEDLEDYIAARRHEGERETLLPSASQSKKSNRAFKHLNVSKLTS